MKTNSKRFTTRVSVTAVRGALIMMALVPAAQAADAAGQEPTVAELTQPASTVEVGVGDVNKNSYKFGEYNGLQRQGPYLIGDVDLRGGGAYDSSDLMRWRITGTDLGLDTRDANVEFGQQGRFRVNFGFDELRHNISDSYQTPYLGAGTNNLSLPGNWVKPTVPQVSTGLNFRGLDPTAGAGSLVNNATGAVSQPTAAQLATEAAAQAADVPAFQNLNLSTQRKRYDAGFSYNVDPQWEIKGSARHEIKNGLQALGVVSEQVSQFSTVIPNVIDQSTDQYNLALNFTGDRKLPASGLLRFDLQ